MSAHNSPESVNSDETILSDGSRLAGWEDSVVAELAQGVPLDMLDTWTGGHSRLVDLLHSNRLYNGPLLDIHLVRMNSPKDELLQILNQEEPPKFAGRDYPGLRAADVEKIPPEHIQGYFLAATATSAAQRGDLGDVYSQIWFIFKPEDARRKRPADVHRYVLRPLADDDAIDRMLGRSIALGRNALSHSLAHTYVAGRANAGATRKSHSRTKGYERLKERSAQASSPILEDK